MSWNDLVIEKSRRIVTEKNIDDFTYDDIKIIGYKSYPAIKLQLNVGL